MLDQGEQAYITLFDTLQQLGDPHIDNLTEADREQVFKYIRDRTGRFLSKDEFATYIEQEEEVEKSRYRFTGEAAEVLKDYYDTVHTLCEAQTNFASSTKVLEKKNQGQICFLRHN